MAYAELEGQVYRRTGVVVVYAVRKKNFFMVQFNSVQITIYDHIAPVPCTVGDEFLGTRMRYDLREE